MNMNDIFPSKFVKAADLRGRDVTVVIGSADIEKIGEDRKLVLYFQGKDKGLVTNKTNADRIAMMYGPDTDDWLGKEIVLYKDFVAFQGKNVEAIRVKPPVTKRAAPPQAAPVQRQHVVTERDGYHLSELRGQPTGTQELPEDGDEIPF